MIVKIQSYFELEKQEDAKSVETELLIEKLQTELEEHLSDSSFKLGGSSWSGTRIRAVHLSREEALDHLRTKK